MKYILLAGFSLLLFVEHLFAYEEHESVRHSFSLGAVLVSDESRTDEYVVNDVPHPRISGSYDYEPRHITGEYAFFFTPIPEDNAIPLVLRRFYAHPTTLQIAFDVSPESDATRVFENFEGTDYRSLRDEQRSSRRADCSLEWYLRRNTGLIFSIHSTKHERDTRFSNSLQTQGQGTIDDIERAYGGGLSHYLSQRLRLRLMYLTFEGETVGSEETWKQESPLLTTETGWETASDGATFLFSTEYIFHAHFGIQGDYTYKTEDGQSRSITSTYNDNFLGGYSSYDVDAAHHTFSALIRWYVNKKLTIGAGGRLGAHEMQRDYEHDLLVDYNWDRFTALSMLSYYPNRHIGLWLEYEYTRQDLDTKQWYPDDPALRTTFATEYTNHAVSAGLTARF